MEEELEVILRAVDEASDTFESVTEAAENMGESVQGGAEAGSQGLDEMEESGEAAADPLEQITNIMGGLAGAEIFSQLADTLWDFADKAGSFEDSMMRARLEAEGAGISVNEMTDTVSELSRVTGRAGGEIRESFIKATARGITDMGSFKQMMIGAGAQATLLGTDIQSMGDKFSSMAMRSTLMERQLASTGITMEELASAMGMTGATADEVKAKWQELDTNQRAAALGMAASMNEGQTANEEYKKSWAGLQEQLDIAKGRLERLAGEVLLPVLIPALEVAGRVLNWLGDTISAVMDGPLGGLVSAIGAVVAGFALVVPAIMAIQGAMALYTASLAPAITATWALLSPWLPFIAIGAAIVALIYEIGKAFGWWTDVGSMIDSIWAGIQRLWSAFINHPDVQGFLSALTAAWNWLVPAITNVVNSVLRFFGVTNNSKFDIVRTLIDSLGVAWQALTLPIRTVINVIKLLWTTMKTVYNNIKTTINNIKKMFSNLPANIRGAISTLKSIITKPFTDAKSSINTTVGNIIKKAESITNISLSGLKSKLTKPFEQAYSSIVDWAKKTYKDAQSWYNSIKPKSSSGGAYGGEDLEFYGGSDLTSYSTEKLSVDMNQNINLSLDLRNVPPSMDERQLAGLINETLDSKEFINRLVNNPDFQSLDNKVKQRIVLKSNRANGRGV
jgi:hypothetical protein